MTVFPRHLCYTILTCLTLMFSWQTGYCVLLSNFKQSPQYLELSFDTIPTAISYTILPNVPHALDHVSIKKNAVHRLNPQKTLRIPIHPKHEPTQHEYAIVIFINDQYLELIRQSSSWLAEKFDYIKPDGYTILGRHTIHQTQDPWLERPQQLSHTLIKAFDYIKADVYTALEPVQVSDDTSLELARDVLYFLWDKPIQQGPTSQSYHTFLTHTLGEKLHLLQSGEFAVMCQGFRDLFLHAAAATPHLKARGVSAQNYAPTFSALIPYAHATAEIWLESSKKWVIFDPWLGIMIARKNGDFVGAFDLQQDNKHPEHFMVVPVVASLPRMHKQHDNTITHHAFHPASIHISDFSCGELGCSPGYIQYFNHITI